MTMQGVCFRAPGEVAWQEVPEPRVEAAGDAIVEVELAGLCGSDLHPYFGREVGLDPGTVMGHEFVGRVIAVGDGVRRVSPSDRVFAPFSTSCGECPTCRTGLTSRCEHGQLFGWISSGVGLHGGQAERVRVPLADGTLFVVPGPVADHEVPGLLTLSDVMGTGHHAAVSAGVGPGDSVAVVGDGAVGLCAIIAAKRLGATTIIAMSRHADRQALAREFGATHVVEARGDEGVAAVQELTGGIGADRVLECVGTKESMDQALRSARPGGMVGYVGVPNGGPELPIRQMFNRNVGVNGGVAPVRGYIEELLPDVRSGAIRPGLVFDLELPLTDAAEAYAAMDERRATKVLLRP